MKKIIALAALSLAVGACDPYEDEPGGTPQILEVFAGGRGGGTATNDFGTCDAAAAEPDDAPFDAGDPVFGTLADTKWTIASGTVDPETGFVSPGVWAKPVTQPGAPEGEDRAFSARGVIIVKTNVLLDGSSIEATPQSCVPANGWLTVTVTGTPDPTGDVWYTCYNPGTPTALEGASIFIYRSPRPPGVLTADIPLRAGNLEWSTTYNLSGTVKTKSGADLPINVDVVTPAEPVVVAPAVCPVTP